MVKGEIWFYRDKGRIESTNIPYLNAINL